eukprot:PhM_4_TR5681/c0_g1_i1/m.73902/K14288/XPOT; exportin-T
MEENFMRAIEVGYNDGAANPVEQKEAQIFLMHLQTTNEGWNLCHSLLSLPSNLVHEREKHIFWAFQLLVNQLPSAAQTMSPEQLCLVFDLCMKWVQTNVCSVPVPPYVRNKCAQALVVYLQCAPPNMWPVFFDSLFKLLDLRGPQQEQTVYLWLRVFQCIDERVVCRDQPRSKEEHARDTLIKDTMREVCINKAVETWYNILSCSYDSVPELANVCLEVLEPYVEWVDIMLFTTKSWIDMIYYFFKLPALRDSAANVMHQLVLKKMPLQQKFNLVIQLRLLDALPHIAEIAVDIAKNCSPEDDLFPGSVTDLAVTVGMRACDMAEENFEGAPAMVNHLCEVVLPLFSASLVLSEKSSEFLQRYLALVKRQVLPVNVGTISKLVAALHVRCLLPVGQHDIDVDDRAYLDYRRMMFNVLRATWKVADEPCVNSTLGLLRSIQQGDIRSCSLQHAEGALRIVFEIGEGMPPAVARDPRIRSIVDLVLQTNYLDHPAPMVHVAFFEVLERYSLVFCQGGPQVEHILQCFLGHANGVRHGFDQARARICYLFAKMCSALRTPFASHAARILDNLQFVMDDSFPAEEKASLFEGLGGVLAHDPDTGGSTAGPRLQLVLNGVVQATKNAMARSNGNLQHPDVVQAVVGNVGALGGLAKTMGNHTALLQDVTDFVMEVLLAFETNPFVREKVLTYFQHYVNSVTMESLPVLQRVMPHMIRTTTTVELGKILRLMSQVVQRVKGACVDLIAPNMPRVVDALPRLVNPECTDLQNLGFMEDYKPSLDALRQYFILLHNLGQYECLAGIAADQLLSHFEFVLHGIRTHPEFDLSKTCLGIISKFAPIGAPLPIERIGATILHQLTAPYFSLNDGKSFVITMEAVAALHALLGFRARLQDGISSVVGPQRAATILDMLQQAQNPGQARQGLVAILREGPPR